MDKRKEHTGLTLIEMLVAVAIVAILASLVITVATRIDSQGKEDITNGLLATLNAALSQFRDYGFIYKTPNNDPCEIAFYRSLKFPLDCNDYSDTELDIIADVLGKTVNVHNVSGHKDEYSGSEGLYFFLNRIPECRLTLRNIDESMLSNLDADGEEMIIEINGRKQPLMRIVDPWGTTLNYDYYDEQEVLSGNFKEAAETIRSFPLITSAGPDKDFGTDDDIYNREKTESTKKL